MGAIVNFLWEVVKFCLGRILQPIAPYWEGERPPLGSITQRSSRGSPSDRDDPLPVKLRGRREQPGVSQPEAQHGDRNSCIGRTQKFAPLKGLASVENRGEGND